MKIIGYERKKTAVIFYQDKKKDPTKFFNGRLNDIEIEKRRKGESSWEENIGHIPVFEMEFNMIERLEQVASGSKIEIIDNDTGTKYSIYNQAILELIMKLISGELYKKDKVMKGVFTLSKKGRQISLVFADKELIKNMIKVV